MPSICWFILESPEQAGTGLSDPIAQVGTCVWPAGTEPSLVNLGCVWYELWCQGTGENDLRMDRTNTVTTAQGGLWAP